MSHIPPPSTSQYSNTCTQNTDAERVPLKKQPTWHQKENNMRSLGEALIAFGSVSTAFAATAIGTTLAGVAFVVSLPVSATVLTASVAAIAVGALMQKAEYWDDPAYIEKIAAKAQTLSFDGIILTYGWKKTCEFHFISQSDLANKFFDSIQKRRMDYNSIVAEYRKHINEYKFISWKSLLIHLVKEVKTENLDFTAFKKKYGNQPLSDGVFTAQDPLFHEMILNGIKNKPYEAIKKEFAYEIKNNALTPQEIAIEVHSQYDKAGSVEAFMLQQGGYRALKGMIDDGYLFASAIKTDIMKQTKSMSASTFIKTFTWDIFEDKIVSGTDFQERFINEVKNTAFSQIIQNFGWNIFKYILATPQQMKARTVSEIVQQKMSFEQIINTFTWKAFTWGVIDGSDQPVRNAFIELAGRKSFCNLWDTYAENIATMHLLPNSALAIVNALSQRKKQAESKYNADIAKLKNAYYFTSSDADALRKKTIDVIQKRVDTVKNEISSQKARESSELFSLDFKLTSLSRRLETVERELRLPILQIKTVTPPAAPPQPVIVEETVVNGNTVPGTRKHVVHNVPTTRRPETLVGITEEEKVSKIRLQQDMMIEAAALQRQRIALVSHYHRIISSLESQLVMEQSLYNQTVIQATTQYNYTIEQAKQRLENGTAACNRVLDSVKSALNAEFAIYYKNNLISA